MENIPDSMCLNVAVKLCIKIIYDTKMQSKKEEAHELQNPNSEQTNARKNGRKSVVDRNL